MRSRIVDWSMRFSTENQQIIRRISSQRARSLLGLPTDPLQTVTLKEVRQAYFAAAKQCHPDMKNVSCHDEFLQLTMAYEALQSKVESSYLDNVEAISLSEEEEFRAACQRSLGVPAEIVEECKQNPMFRRWLGGNTDAAHTWRDFFVQNGGLAPKLRPVAGWLESGNDATLTTSRRRRKRG